MNGAPIRINLRKGSSTSVGARAADEGLGGPLGSPAYLFIWLTSCGDMTPPHPAGDPKGPPNPSSSTLAPTDRPASRLASRLRLLPGGRHSWRPYKRPDYLFMFIIGPLTFSTGPIVVVYDTMEKSIE